MQDRDLILSSDQWRLVVNIDLSPYEDVIATLQENLVQVEEFVKPHNPINELRQVKATLSSLENRLEDLKDLLPKVDARRGLLNLGGSVLKVLFGTVTVADLEKLHETVERLHRNEKTVVHAVNQHVTYIKHLDDSVKFNAQIVSNLSTVVKSIALRMNSELASIVSELQRLNDTFEKQREVNIVTRQIEFALSQLEIQISEIFHAIAFVRAGKIPVNLISPSMLYNMLRNVTLILPENQELAMGMKRQNLHLYYDTVKVMMLADTHSLRLVLYFPLKSTNRDFTLYRIVVVPARMFGKRYAQFSLAYNYLAINLLQQNYVLLTDLEIMKCSGVRVMVCPADKAVFSTKLKTCELSLFLQSEDARELCHRKVLQNPVHQVLEQQGPTRIYFLPDTQMVHFKCLEGSGWTTTALELGGAGLLQKATACYITTPQLQMFPERRGETMYTVQPPALYLPTGPPIVARHEVQALQQIIPWNATDLERLTSNLESHQHGDDINELMHLHTLSLRHETKSNWIILVCISIATILIFFMAYYFTLSHLRKLIASCTKKTHETPVAETERVPVEIIPITRQVQINPRSDHPLEEVPPTAVRFSTYSVQSA
jgi:hypothetical protein